MLKKTIKIVISTISRKFPTMASRALYLIVMKRPLHLKNPQWFSEKLMRLKLDNYLNNPLVWQCADKFRVRAYLEGKGLEVNDMPTIIGSYENANDINFDALPDKFALKCTHGAGFNIVCTDKNMLDRERSVNLLNRWLETTYGLDTAETHYGKVPPRIICESFIESEGGNLPNDYKVYCFNGVPMYVMACTDRKVTAKVNIMDLMWRDTGYIDPRYASTENVPKPATLKSMLRMSALASRDFPFVRVDFYEDRGRAILGELTFTPHACVNSNMTTRGQVELGKQINLDYNRVDGDVR